MARTARRQRRARPLRRAGWRVAAGAAAGCCLFACGAPDTASRRTPGAIQVFDDLFSVSVVDDRHAVAVGYHGAAYLTEDAGDSWQAGLTGTQRPLFSVSMAGPQHGWAVGQAGTVLRTVDGGRSWRSVENPRASEGLHLLGVQALDADSAWVVGEWGTRLLGRDGGRSWEDRSLGIDSQHPLFAWLSPADQDRVRQGRRVSEDVVLSDVFCLPQPERGCWIAGEFGTILRSDDRGASWERGEILADQRPERIVFEYDGIGVGDVERDRLARFAGELSHAPHLNVQLEPFASPREIQEFGRGDDPTRLFDLLSARLGEVRAALEDAGVQPDRLRMPDKPPWDYEDFVEDDPGFLDRYFEGRRAERGAVHVSVIQNPFLFTVFFEDAERGYASGLGGVILRSDDAGRTWRYQIAEGRQAVYAIASSRGRALAVGEKGLVRASLDAGASWREPPPRDFPPTYTFLRDLGFAAAGALGFIVGQEGTILRSRDGGRSWARVLPPPEPPARAAPGRAALRRSRSRG